METVWVAFQFETPAEVTIPRARITIFAAEDGSLLVRSAEAGVRVPAVGLPLFRLPDGEYKAMVIADGWSFAWPLDFSVSDDTFDEENPREDNSADNPVVFTFRAASSSVRPGSGLPFLVRGHVSATPYTSQVTGPTLGVTRKGAFSHSETTTWRVTFTHMGEVGAPGLRRGSIYQAPVDRNGAFTVDLPPRSLFSVAVPGRSGVSYILTGDAGQESDLDSLMTASQSTRLDQLVRP